MKIQQVHIERFRSIQDAVMTRCGGMNVLIGKNNAGKSNLLGAIETSLNHLKRTAIAGPWTVTRPVEEITDRDLTAPPKISVQFELPQDIKKALGARLSTEFPQLAKTIEELEEFDSIVFVIDAAIVNQRAFT